MIDIDIDISQRLPIDIDIDIDIFQNCLIDIDIFQNCLINIDIFVYDHIDIVIDIFQKCRYIDNRYYIYRYTDIIDILYIEQGYALRDASDVWTLGKWPTHRLLCMCV